MIMQYVMVYENKDSQCRSQDLKNEEAVQWEWVWGVGDVPAGPGQSPDRGAGAKTPKAVFEKTCATTQNKMPCYRKEDRAMRPIYGCTGKISGVPDYVHGYY